MIHDEKTTEIEIPNKKATSNVVRVDFVAQGESRKSSALPAHHRPVVMSVSAKQSSFWFRDLDLSSPWVLRLIAVIAILALSFLII